MRLGARIKVVLAAALVMSAVPVLASVEPVEAAWRDSEFATTAVTAATLVAPVKSGACVPGFAGLNVTYSWTQPSGGASRTGYVLGIYRNGALQAETSLGATATSGSTSGLLSSLLGNQVYEVRVQAVSGAWRSPTIVGTFTTTAVGLVGSCTW